MNALALLFLPRSFLHGAFFKQRMAAVAHWCRTTRYNETSSVEEKLKFRFCLDDERYSVLKMGL